MILSSMRLVPRDGHEAVYVDNSPALPTVERLASHVRRTLVDACGALHAAQHPAGHWQGRRSGEAALTAEYLLLLAFLGEADSPRAQAAARWIEQQQRDSGGWSLYPDGPFDSSASVLAYFSLKIADHEPCAEHMQRAREAILAGGGMEPVDDRTRRWLALFGQIPYSRSWLPAGSGRNDIWKVLAARQHVQKLDSARGIRELLLTHPGTWSRGEFSRRQRIAAWGRALFGRLSDRSAVRASSESPDTLDASSLIWKVVAGACLGRANESRSMKDWREQLESLAIHEDETLCLQPAPLRTRDTALATEALLAAGETRDTDSLANAREWLIEQPLEGLAAEDAARVALALVAESASNENWRPSGLQLFNDGNDNERRGDDRLARREHAFALNAAERRMLALQQRNGGWGGADTTGLVLQALGALGHRAGSPAIDRAIRGLRLSQLADGSWAGSQGVYTLCGTSNVLRGLAAVGVPAANPLVDSGAQWLLAHQQACGGWGESPACVHDPRLRGQGPVTASQTSWALLGLVASGRVAHSAVLRGVRFLISEQTEEGDWHEPEFTTIDPSRGGYLRCDLDRTSFPLLALSRWAAECRRSNPD